MPTTNSTTKNYYYGLGRRKSATARIRLTLGKGNILVNDVNYIDYFKGSKYLISKFNNIFGVVDQVNKYDITVKVSGGGLDGQTEAIVLGIAKAMVAYNQDLKSTLKKADLLSRDSRDKERKKFGFKSARKQRQFTKR